MPRYNFQCKSCKHTIDVTCRISQLDEQAATPCTQCGGEMQQVILEAPTFNDPWGVDVRSPKSRGGFNDVLQSIHERSPGSNLNQIL